MAPKRRIAWQWSGAVPSAVVALGCIQAGAQRSMHASAAEAEGAVRPL
jgi:hypothetical protein